MAFTANWQKDIELGARLAAESHSLFEEIGSRQGMGKASLAQAGACLFSHDYETAYSLFMESLQIARESNDQALVLTELAGLAAVTHHLGRHGECLEVALQGLAEAVEARHEHVIVWMLDLIASFCAAHAPVEAVVLEASAAAHRARAGGGVLPEYLEITDARSVAEAAMDSERLDEAWRAGNELDLERAVALARRLGSRMAQSATVYRGPIPAPSLSDEQSTQRTSAETQVRWLGSSDQEQTQPATSSEE